MLIKSIKKNKITQKKKLKNTKLDTFQNILFYFPIRYEDRTQICQIKNLVPGISSTVKGKILHCKIIPNVKKKIMVCQITDGSGILSLQFFHFHLKMKIDLKIGRFILVYGKIKKNSLKKEMIHPKYYLQTNLTNPNFFEKKIVPIYPTKKGIKQKTLYQLTTQALTLLRSLNINELLPIEIVKKVMISFPDAIRILHRPTSSFHLTKLKKRKHPAQKRLIFEELLAYDLSMLALRDNKKKLFYSHPLPVCNRLKNKFLSLLSFSLTCAQVRVIKEIERDLLLKIPMTRLIQGDVGSGKTIVAAFAALRAITHGKQVAMMVPTEILAEQHANKFYSWFSPLGIRIGLLTGKQKKEDRLKQEKDIFIGKIKMVIGTHALFQERIQFNCLALIIIDEQHRFGVHQRFSLWKKGIRKKYRFYPHQLIMTATPIPRTLAMTIYSGLDISIIDEVPPGRTPITTVVIPNSRRNDLFNRVYKACINENRQAYWICTIIEELKSSKLKAAKSVLKEIQSAFPKLKVGLIHGRMKSTEKKSIMKSFKEKKIHLLIATTIVEVGVDIPNASLMVIENPERLGLAQLHQLRGRIGRGSINSYCVLLYSPPIFNIEKKRLQVLRSSNDGFVIAQKDLEIRGPGELLGTQQTGIKNFKIANLLYDKKLIPKIHRIAKYMYKNYPNQSTELIDRWISKINDYYSANI